MKTKQSCGIEPHLLDQAVSHAVGSFLDSVSCQMPVPDRDVTLAPHSPQQPTTEDETEFSDIRTSTSSAEAEPEAQYQGNYLAVLESLNFTSDEALLDGIFPSGTSSVSDHSVGDIRQGENASWA